MGRKGDGIEIREGAIRLSFSVDGKPVKRTLKVAGKALRPTPANLKYAQRLGVEIREKINHGTFSMAEYFPSSGNVREALTVGAQLDAWWATLRMEVSTLAGYSSAVKFWKSVSRSHDEVRPLGEMPLRTLKLSHILTGLATRPNLSGKTVNNYVSVLREALELAVAEKLLAENPAAQVPRATWQRDPPDPFSREEAERIIADMQERYPPGVANMVEWRFFTGVRTSEMVGLKWPSVDLASGQMQIREAVVRGVQKDRTKTGVARTVSLNSRALSALQRQRELTQLTGGTVWLAPKFELPWSDERAFRRSYWTPSLKRLGIRYRPPNNMRHTYATMMLMAGRTPAWCARQLGHSVEMFLRTYAKWLDGAQDDREVKGLEAWLATSLPHLGDSKKNGRR